MNNKQPLLNKVRCRPLILILLGLAVIAYIVPMFYYSFYRVSTSRLIIFISALFFGAYLICLHKFTNRHVFLSITLFLILSGELTELIDTLTSIYYVSEAYLILMSIGVISKLIAAILLFFRKKAKIFIYISLLSVEIIVIISLIFTLNNLIDYYGVLHDLYFFTNIVSLSGTILYYTALIIFFLCNMPSARKQKASQVAVATIEEQLVILGRQYENHQITFDEYKKRRAEILKNL